MRDWTKLRPASFRGVRFHVMQDGPTVGRRIAVHEISGSEDVLTEDMGRANPSFTIDAYVAGDLADLAGLALERACAAPGASLLVLPVDPGRFVHCTSCTRRRHKDSNGFMAYTLEFVSAGGAGSGGFTSGLAALKGAFAAGLSALARGLSR